MKQDKITIQDTIIVEGRDDLITVKNAVNAYVYVLHGYSSLSSTKQLEIEMLFKDKPVIILTDPDFAGKKIRQILTKLLPHAKHAFISRKNATLKDNIGVENASKEHIIEALKEFINQKKEKPIISTYTYSINDLIEYNFVGTHEAKKNREKIGEILSIGYHNAKQLVHTLNSFHISYECFKNAALQIN